MKKASEYRAHAHECRELAKKMKIPEQREYLIQMAADWEEMATYRTGLIALHPELAKEGEHEEESKSPPSS